MTSTIQQLYGKLFNAKVRVNSMSRKFSATTILLMFLTAAAGPAYADGGVGSSGGGGSGGGGVGGGISPSSDNSSGSSSSSSTSTTTSTDSGSSGSSSTTTTSTTTTSTTSTNNTSTSDGSDDEPEVRDDFASADTSNSATDPVSTLPGWCGLIDGTRFEVNWNDAPQFSVGVLFPDGIEPGDPQDCEAPAGNRCWYIDADAPNGGDGSFQNPYNDFDEAIGFANANFTSYTKGLMAGGDYVYLKGEFKSKKIQTYRGKAQGGTYANPTVIKSYRGGPRAIMNGEFQVQPINIRGTTNSKFESIVIQNIEVKNAKGVGIHIDDSVESAMISGVVVHDSSYLGGAANMGGIVYEMATAKHTHTLCNSHVYQNYRSTDGSSYANKGNGNRGGVGIFSELNALDDSVITIKGNTIFDEDQGIRHKHAGDVKTEIYSNYISHVHNGFWVRSHFNEAHHNVFYNTTEAAVRLVGEIPTGDMYIDFYNNTVVNASALVETGPTNVAFARDPNVYNNIFYDTDGETIFKLAKDAGKTFPLTGWSSSNNLYYTADPVQFLIHEAINYGPSAALTFLNEQNSIQQDPMFEEVNDPNQLDLRLKNGSPALGAGVGGEDLGAY